jgi:hypothetical protein
MELVHRSPPFNDAFSEVLMTQAAIEIPFPSLFIHATRSEWGAGILAWEAGGKRGYLFENGQERPMASGFHELMRRVEQPNAEQRAAYVRLQRLLAARRNSSAPKSNAQSLLDQLARLHELYPAGMLDPKWVTEVRGDGAEGRAPRHREQMIQEAQARLSCSALDALLSNSHYGQLWDHVLTVLGHTDLVPAIQLKKPKSLHNDQLRPLALAVRELLYGTATYEQRFDRYLGALAEVFGEPARWELATALSAVVHPAQHVCVHLMPFRQQLKATGTRGSAGARASSADYARFLGVARLVANKLAEQGEVPRDLLDVHDFIRITQKPATKARTVSKKISAARVLAQPSAEN